jgi:hypothetical protein
MGSGDQIYQRLVKPKCVTLDKVVNHFAISSLFDGNQRGKKVFSYRVERIHYERIEKDQDLLVVGQVKVTSDISPDSKEFLFGLLPSNKELFRTWVSEKKEGLHFDTLKEKGQESLGQGEEEVAKVLTSFLGNRTFTVRDTFKEERQALLQKLVQKEFDEHCQVYEGIFNKSRLAVEALSREGLEIPYEIRVAAEVTLSNRLFQEINELKRDFERTQARGEIGRIIEEAKEHGYQLRKEKSLFLLNKIFNEKISTLQTNKGSELARQTKGIEEVITLLDLTKQWGFEISLEEGQNLVKEILDECVGGLEEYWWGDGVAKPFPANLIPLAEKLGLNVEKYLKISTPNMKS